jgi:hypothetical protein
MVVKQITGLFLALQRRMAEEAARRRLQRDAQRPAISLYDSPRSGRAPAPLAGSAAAADGPHAQPPPGIELPVGVGALLRRVEGGACLSRRRR